MISANNNKYQYPIMAVVNGCLAALNASAIASRASNGWSGSGDVAPMKDDGGARA